MKKKVCIFILGFHNGGVENVLYNYYLNMDLTPYDMHIVVYIDSIREKEKLFKDLGFTVHRMSYVHGHKITAQNIKEHREFFEKNQFDIVHNNFPENLLPLLFAKIYKVPIRILHSHNDYKRCFEGKSALKKKLYGIGLKINTFNATDLIACSENAAITAFGEDKITQTTILYNAFNIERFQYNELVRKQLRNRLHLDESVFVIGHVGRYETDQKNQDFIIDLFSSIANNNNDYRLLLVGDGEKRKEIEEKAKKLGLYSDILFVGNVLNVEDYYQVMDCFILPSKFEGLGIVAVEAQVSGLPCILSDAVPKEAKVCDRVLFLSTSSQSQWREAIDNIKQCSNSVRDTLSNDDIIKYNIHKTARVLEGIYEGKNETLLR